MRGGLFWHFANTNAFSKKGSEHRFSSLLGVLTFNRELCAEGRVGRKKNDGIV